MQFMNWLPKSVILIGSALLGVCAVQGDEREDQFLARISRFKDQDLRKLSESDQSEFAKLTGREPGQRWDAPWYCWEDSSTKGVPRFIVFGDTRLIRMPGGSRASVSVLDSKGKSSNSFEFSTGWRIDVLSAQWHMDPSVGKFVLDIKSSGNESRGQNGRDIRRQVYAFIGDRLALVGLERSGGAIIDNDYEHPNHKIGPSVPHRSAEEWEKALASTDKAEVLEALLWLGGSHLVGQGRPNVLVEKEESASLVSQVRQRPGVKEQVDRLAKSDNKFISEMAIFAQKAHR